jgi:hypothetical protein
VEDLMQRTSWAKDNHELQLFNIDSDVWEKAIQRVDLMTADARQIHYEGITLRSLPSQLQIIEFTFNSSSLYPAEIIVPLVVSSEAEIKLFINQEEIGTILVAVANTEPMTLYYLSKEVTKWSELEKQSQLRIQIYYRGKEGTTTLFLDSTQPDLHPHLRQCWVRSYVFQSALFFILAWGTLLGLGLLLVAHLPLLEESLKYYAILLVIGSWAASVIGLPDLAKIPVHFWLRRAYALTRIHRPLSLIILSVLFLVAATGTSIVIYCINQHRMYAELIRKAIETAPSSEREEYIRRAFVQLPWRKEAQLLFERSAWSKRRERQKFENYIRAFTDDQVVQKAIEKDLSEKKVRGKSNGGIALKTNSPDELSDPVIWYASLLPEGEIDGKYEKREKAVEYLIQKTGNKIADLQRLSLQLELYDIKYTKSTPRWKEDHRDDYFTQTAAYIEPLTKLLQEDQNASSHLSNYFSYQIACDLVALYYLKLCQSEEASEMFDLVMRIRKFSRPQQDEYPWYRPPEKLNLFHLFMTQGREKKSNDSSIKIKENFEGLIEENLEGLMNECPEFKASFKENFLDKYPDYIQRKSWEGNSDVLAPEATKYITDKLLKRNWRY